MHRQLGAGTFMHLGFQAPALLGLCTIMFFFLTFSYAPGLLGTWAFMREDFYVPGLLCAWTFMRLDFEVPRLI